MIENNITRRKVPVQQRSIEKVEKILDCVAANMIEGNTQLTTRQIAAQTGLSPGTIYQFFNNVEEVRETLIRRLMDELFNTIEAVVKKSTRFDLAGVTDEMIVELMVFYEKNKKIAQTLMASQYTQEFLVVNDEVNKRTHGVMVDYIRRHNNALDDETISRIVDVTISISDILFLKVWAMKDEALRDAYVIEWRRAARAYTNAALSCHQKT